MTEHGNWAADPDPDVNAKLYSKVLICVVFDAAKIQKHHFPLPLLLLSFSPSSPVLSFLLFAHATSIKGLIWTHL